MSASSSCPSWLLSSATTRAVAVSFLSHGLLKRVRSSLSSSSYNLLHYYITSVTGLRIRHWFSVLLSGILRWMTSTGTRRNCDTCMEYHRSGRLGSFRLFKDLLTGRSALIHQIPYFLEQQGPLYSTEGINNTSPLPVVIFFGFFTSSLSSTSRAPSLLWPFPTAMNTLSHVWLSPYFPKLFPFYLPFLCRSVTH